MKTCSETKLLITFMKILKMATLELFCCFFQITQSLCGFYAAAATLFSSCALVGVALFSECVFTSSISRWAWRGLLDVCFSLSVRVVRSFYIAIFFVSGFELVCKRDRKTK